MKSVPNIGIFFSSRNLANFIAVCPPNCNITPSGFSFSIIFNTSSSVNGSKYNLDFSARDRINRAPKALGFVSLNPTIELTEVGKLFVTSKRKEEILLSYSFF